MKTAFVIVFAVFAAACLRAQPTGTPEPLTAWPYYKEIPVQRGAGTLADFVLDRDVFDKARTDQADLRLYDSTGREIPYVLRVLRVVTTSEAFEAREFNRGTEGGMAQVSYDLGEQPPPHNQVEVETAGSDFRRSTDVQGSSDGERWSTLAASAILFNFSASGRTAEQDVVAYPVSRYRYLRIRVRRDPETDAAPPEIAAVRVRRTIERKGENAAFPGSLERRDPDRVDGRPSSIWRVDFGGRIPVDSVQISMSDGVFSRPFRLEGVDDPAQPVDFGSGELSRREGSSQTEQAIPFSEQFARRLRLTVTDDRNTALGIYSITGRSAARQVVFETANAGAGAVRLYYGNPKALAPRYDLAAKLPEELASVPSRLALGMQQENPIYRPEPKPFSERSPWLVYVVLGLATLVLAAILLNLARAAKALETTSEPAA